MATMGSKGSKGFFGAVHDALDPDKKLRDSMDLNRKEMVNLRKALQGISPKAAGGNSYKEIKKSLIESLAAAQADAEKRSESFRAKMLRGKIEKGTASKKEKAEHTKLAAKDKEAAQSDPAVQELIKLIEELEAARIKGVEKARRLNLGFWGRRTEDFLKVGEKGIEATKNLLKPIMGIGASFLKGFAKEFWKSSGGKQLTEFFGKKFGKFGETIREAFDKSAVGKGLKKFTKGFSDWTEKWISSEKRKEFLDKLRNKGAKAGGLLGKVAGYAALAAAVGAIGYKVGEWLNDQITELLGMPLGKWIYKKVEAVKKFFGEAIDYVKNIPHALATMLYDVVQQIKAMPEDFAKWWKDFSIVDTLTGGISDVFSTVTDALDRIGSKVAKFLHLDWGGIKAGGKAVGARAASAAGSTIDYAKGLAHTAETAYKGSNFFGGKSDLNKVGGDYGKSSVKIGSGDTVDAKVYSDIQAAAKGAGIDPATMMAFAKQESGFGTNMNSGTSSAKGLFQFTKGTWEQYSKKLGYSASDVNDPAKNATAAAAFLKDNKTYLESKGIKAGPNELYAAHFLGAGGAVTFFKALGKDPGALGAALMPAAAKANKNVFYDVTGEPRTLAEIYQVFDKKIGATAIAMGGTPTATPGGATAVASGGATPASLAMPTTGSSPAASPTANPTASSNSIPAANATPNIDDIPMFVADTGMMVVTAVGAYT